MDLTKIKDYDEVTSRQKYALDLLAQAGFKFQGKTKQEASEFIGYFESEYNELKVKQRRAGRSERASRLKRLSKTT